MCKPRHSSNELSAYDYIFDLIIKDCRQMFTQQNWATLCDCSRQHFNDFANKKKRDWRVLFIVLEYLQRNITIDFYQYDYQRNANKR